MHPSRAWLFAFLILLPGMLALVPPAEAVGSTAISGCARLTHYQTSAPTTASTFRVSTDTSSAPIACSATSATYIEPVCTTFNVKYLRSGASAPSDPNRWIVYFVDESHPGGDETTPGTTNDHGAAGTSNWGYAWTGSRTSSDPNYAGQFTSNPDGQTLTFCPDHGALYRIVLRMCQLVINQPQQSCGTAATNYDVNSDENPTCSCSGQDSGALYSADGNPADMQVDWNPEVRDPLTIRVKEKKVGYLTNEPVNVTIDARFLNTTLRPGAASNITLHFEAPDHTWPVDGANPTEMKFSDGTGMGRYYYWFTPTQAGTYELTARTISSLNERTISKPFDLEVLAVGGRPLTRDDLNQTNSYTNSTLTELKALLANLNNYQATERNSTKTAIIDADAALTNNAAAYLATRLNTTEANVIAAVAALVNNAAGYLATRGNASEANVIAAVATLTNNLGNYLALLQNSTTAPLMRSVHGENVNAYLAALANSTTAPLARSVHLENVNDRIETRLNGTEAMLSYFGTGIFALSNASLTATEFRAWNVGEFRPASLTLNGTAREASLVYYGSGIYGVVNLTLTAAEFRDWNVGEFRPTSVTVNATLPTTIFTDWRDGESRPAWATLNTTDARVWNYVSRGLTDEAGFTLASGSIVAATFAPDAISGAAFSQAAADKSWLTSIRTLTGSSDPTSADIATAIWNYGDRALTDKGGFTLSSAEHDDIATETASAVWEERLADHTTSGTYGRSVPDAHARLDAIPGLVDANMVRVSEDQRVRFEGYVRTELRGQLAPSAAFLEHHHNETTRPSGVEEAGQRLRDFVNNPPSTRSEWAQVASVTASAIRPKDVADVVTIAALLAAVLVALLLAPRKKKASEQRADRRRGARFWVSFGLTLAAVYVVSAIARAA